MRKSNLFSFILSTSIFLVSLATVSAEDDAQKEEYLFKIYQKYNSQPTPQEVWEKALSQRPSQEYKIVAGDTLWDVSRTLFMDGFFWSKVWALNPYITNPHQIKVGQVIHFYLGSGLDAPGLKVNSSPDTPVITPQTSLQNTRWWLSQGLPTVPVDLSDVSLPPPHRVYPKVLENFPSSLPNWYFQTDAEVNKVPLEILPLKLQPIENILSLPYFISEFPQNIKGTIFEVEKNAKTASERDFLFIHSNQGLKIGETYTVIQSIGKIRDPDALEDFPKSYEVQGEVKVVGEVEGLYKALVTLALFPIQVGANVVPGLSPKMNLTEPGEVAPIKGMIIGGENDTTRSLFGPQSIIYINRGEEDGIKLNQRAPVMAIHRLRHAESSIFSNTWKIGEIKIVKVEKNYSTAVIMVATEGIMPGDLVGNFTPGDMNEKIKSIDSSTQFGDDFEDESTGPLKKPLTESELENFEAEEEGKSDQTSSTEATETESEVEESADSQSEDSELLDEEEEDAEGDEKVEEKKDEAPPAEDSSTPEEERPE